MMIRQMTIDDYDKVYDLWINTVGMGLNNVDDSKEGIDKFLRRNPTTCLVAEKDSQITGVILGGHDGRRGYIYHTTVREEYRKQGIGKTLVESVMQAFKNEGITKVALVVFAKNKLGNKFWEKLGFVARTDLVYRNKNICELERIDT
ncbi:MAG: GNAT family N-acetyltransferase [Lachnospiraceae bacterium]|nr:GNAT family N-acetyltransferase [Lachnospiraceae bacterium]